MKEEKLFEVIGDINENYVAEAHMVNSVKRKNLWLRWGTIAACLCVVVVGTIALFNLSGLIRKNTNIRPLSVQAEELGKEEYQFGATLPTIIYSDNDKVILYDFRGIYVYSFIKEELVGYVDFRKLEMDRIQGDNPTFLNVTEDGCFVRFFNDSKKYVYEVEKNDYFEVEEYEDEMENQYQITQIYFGEKDSISDDQMTYVGNDGAYLAVEINLENLEDEIPRYKNMYILRKDGDVIHEYYVFE